MSEGREGGFIPPQDSTAAADGPVGQNDGNAREVALAQILDSERMQGLPEHSKEEIASVFRGATDKLDRLASDYFLKTDMKILAPKGRRHILFLDELSRAISDAATKYEHALTDSYYGMGNEGQKIKSRLSREDDSEYRKAQIKEIERLLPLISEQFKKISDL
jgi:hypothetical protein